MPDLREERVRGQSLSRLYQDKADRVQAQAKAIPHRAAYGVKGPGPWRSVGPRNINGRIKCLAVHPDDADVVYAGAASGGVWKTVDGGRSWRPLGEDREGSRADDSAVAVAARRRGDPVTAQRRAPVAGQQEIRAAGWERRQH